MSTGEFNEWRHDSRHVFEKLQEVKDVIEKFAGNVSALSVSAAQLMTRIDTSERTIRDLRADLEKMRDEREDYRSTVAAQFAGLDKEFTRLETNYKNTAALIAGAASIVTAIVTTLVVTAITKH